MMTLGEILRSSPPDTVIDDGYLIIPVTAYLALADDVDLNRPATMIAGGSAGPRGLRKGRSSTLRRNERPIHVHLRQHVES